MSKNSTMRLYSDVKAVKTTISKEEQFRISELLSQLQYLIISMNSNIMADMALMKSDLDRIHTKINMKRTRLKRVNDWFYKLACGKKWHK